MVWLWIVLIVAVVGLAFLALRTRFAVRWMGQAVMNLMFAALALYLINVIGILGSLTIPLNLPNVIIVGVLGIPGLGLIAAVHTFIL